MKIQFYKNTDYASIIEPHYFFLSGTTYKIPEGFLFDGGSIPRVLWVLGHPFYFKYLKAFLEHDFLYSNYFHERVYKGEYAKYSRKEADLNFLNSIENKILKYIFYIGVRIGGWVSYGDELKIKKEDLIKL